jgi:hypothetical protein
MTGKKQPPAKMLNRKLNNEQTLKFIITCCSIVPIVFKIRLDAAGAIHIPDLFETGESFINALNKTNLH